MRALFTLGALTATLNFCTGHTCQAQSLLAVESPLADSTAHPAPATLYKLGTGLTRGLNVGGHLGFSLPIVAGVEHQFAPAWAAFGNVSSGWRIGRRATPTTPNDPPGALITELGVDVGLRRYYRQAQRRVAGHATGAFVGNYIALQAKSSFIPAYSPSSRLARDYYGATLLWGGQRRFGAHGLVDAYAGGGLHHQLQGLMRNDWQWQPVLEVGLKVSLVN